MREVFLRLTHFLKEQHKFDRASEADFEILISQTSSFSPREYALTGYPADRLYYKDKCDLKMNILGLAAKYATKEQFFTLLALCNESNSYAASPHKKLELGFELSDSIKSTSDKYLSGNTSLARMLIRYNRFDIIEVLNPSKREDRNILFQTVLELNDKSLTKENKLSRRKIFKIIDQKISGGISFVKCPNVLHEICINEIRKFIAEVIIPCEAIKNPFHEIALHYLSKILSNQYIIDDSDASCVNEAIRSVLKKFHISNHLQTLSEGIYTGKNVLDIAAEKATLDQFVMIMHHVSCSFSYPDFYKAKIRRAYHEEERSSDRARVIPSIPTAGEYLAMAFSNGVGRTLFSLAGGVSK